MSLALALEASGVLGSGLHVASAGAVRELVSRVTELVLLVLDDIDVIDDSASLESSAHLQAAHERRKQRGVAKANAVVAQADVRAGGRDVGVHGVEQVAQLGAECVVRHGGNSNSTVTSVDDPYTRV